MKYCILNARTLWSARLVFVVVNTLSSPTGFREVYVIVRALTANKNLQTMSGRTRVANLFIHILLSLSLSSHIKLSGEVKEKADPDYEEEIVQRIK